MHRTRRCLTTSWTPSTSSRIPMWTPQSMWTPATSSNRGRKAEPPMAPNCRISSICARCTTIRCRVTLLELANETNSWCRPVTTFLLSSLRSSRPTTVTAMQRCACLSRPSAAIPRGRSRLAERSTKAWAGRCSRQATHRWSWTTQWSWVAWIIRQEAIRWPALSRWTAKTRTNSTWIRRSMLVRAPTRSTTWILLTCPTSLRITPPTRLPPASYLTHRVQRQKFQKSAWKLTEPRIRDSLKTCTTPSRATTIQMVRLYSWAIIRAVVIASPARRALRWVDPRTRRCRWHSRNGYTR